MIFSELEIENFRSIDEVGIKISFDEPLNLYALVGSNNSGKTNILDTLALVLGIRSGKFYNYRLTDADFYNQDISKPIHIKLTLSKPLHYRDVYQGDCKIEGFVFSAKTYASGEDKGRVHTDHYCFGTNRKGQKENPLMDSARMYKQKKTPDDEDIDNQRKPVLAKDNLYKLGGFYFLDIAYLTSFFKLSGYGPLGRLFKLYRDDFEGDSSFYTFQENGRQKKLASKEAFKKAAKRINEILRTDKLIEIEELLSDNVSQYLGLDDDQKTSVFLALPAHEQVFESLTRLKIKENVDLEALEITKLGSGYLSLFRLAALRALAEMTVQEPALYLIEEPEIYLHPHLRRFFYKTLKLLAEKGSQVIFTTHSPEFVNLSDNRSIIRVEKSNASTVCCQVPPKVNINFDKVHQKIKRKGNSEIFFAQHVLLTEGQDDKVVFEEVLAKGGLDCDAKSVSVIDCDSKRQIPDYIRLCQCLNIDFFVTFDTDPGNATSASDTDKILKVLNNDTSRYNQLPDTLEKALKTSKSEDNWKHLFSIIEPLSYNEIQKEFPDISDAIKPFLSKFKKKKKPARSSVKVT